MGLLFREPKMKLPRGAWALAVLALLAGCAADAPRRDAPAMTAAEGRALVGSLLPKGVGDQIGRASCRERV